MLSVVREYKDYSVLGHMDLIARYDEKGVYPFEKIKPIVEEILQVVIADGKGLEVNTSSYRLLEQTIDRKSVVCSSIDLQS